MNDTIPGGHTAKKAAPYGHQLQGGRQSKGRLRRKCRKDSTGDKENQKRGCYDSQVTEAPRKQELSMISNKAEELNKIGLETCLQNPVMTDSWPRPWPKVMRVILPGCVGPPLPSSSWTKGFQYTCSKYTCVLGSVSRDTHC